MTAPGLEDLPGTELPGGTFIIPAEEDGRYRELVGGPPSRDGTAHPLWAFIASQRGMAIGVGDVFALAGFDIEAEGPMLGECEIQLRRPLRHGERYQVAGVVVGIERKVGRRLGTFDLLHVRYTLSDAHGEAASYLSVVVLPRGRAG